MHIRPLALGALAAFAVASAAASVDAAPREVRIASHVSALSPLHQQSQMFADAIEARLPGQFAFTLYPGGQLGKEKDLIANVQAGSIEMINVASGVMKLDKKLGVFDLPWLFADRAHVQRAMKAGLENAVRDRVEEVGGVRVIGVYENGFRHVINGARAVRTPSDLDGAPPGGPGPRSASPSGGVTPRQGPPEEEDAGGGPPRGTQKGPHPPVSPPWTPGRWLRTPLWRPEPPACRKERFTTAATSTSQPGLSLCTSRLPSSRRLPRGGRSRFCSAEQGPLGRLGDVVVQH